MNMSNEKYWAKELRLLLMFFIIVCIFDNMNLGEGSE